MNITEGINSGQVLQRRGTHGAAARLQGACEGAGTVHATLWQKGKPVKGWPSRPVGKAAKGTFSARLASIPVGGPYRLRLDLGKESVTVDDLFVGDVWILAGQSNMEGCGSLQKRTPSNPLVRALYMNGQWGRAEDPLHDPYGTPDPDHAPVQWSPRVRARLKGLRAKGVGPGIAFAAEMVERHGGVPQGLIPCAHGGTRMEQWDPRREFVDGWMYRSLMRVCRNTGQPFAGVLWYQGESDADGPNAALYFKRMVRMIRFLRSDLRQPRLPFLLVQLGREVSPATNLDGWNRIQLDQARLAAEVDRVACVAAIDLPLEDTIHIRSEGQFRLGRRLAAAADRLVHGNRAELPAPEIASVVRIRHPHFYRTEKLGLDVTFRHVVGPLRASDPAGGFFLLDSAGRLSNPFYHGTIRGNTIRLEGATNVSDAEEYRLIYGSGRQPACRLTDSRDMAVPVSEPIPIVDPRPFSAPISKWLISTVVSTKKTIGEIDTTPPPESYHLPEWENRGIVMAAKKPPADIAGIVFFSTTIEAAETMSVNLCLGSDGPLRIWLDGNLLFTHSDGTNPVMVDEIIHPLRLKRGRHRLDIAMDFRGGLAWGFLLRFAPPGSLRRPTAGQKPVLPRCCL